MVDKLSLKIFLSVDKTEINLFLLVYSTLFFTHIFSFFPSKRGRLLLSVIRRNVISLILFSVQVMSPVHISYYILWFPERSGS